MFDLEKDSTLTVKDSDSLGRGTIKGELYSPDEPKTLRTVFFFYDRATLNIEGGNFLGAGGECRVLYVNRPGTNVSISGGYFYSDHKYGIYIKNGTFNVDGGFFDAKEGNYSLDLEAYASASTDLKASVKNCTATQKIYGALGNNYGKSIITPLTEVIAYNEEGQVENIYHGYDQGVLWQTYTAARFEFRTPKIVSDLEINGVQTPKDGETVVPFPADGSSPHQLSEGIKETWYGWGLLGTDANPRNDLMGAADPFVGGASYVLELNLKAKDGYALDDLKNLEVSINGKAPYKVEKTSDGLKVFWKYVADCSKPKIFSQPKAKTVFQGENPVFEVKAVNEYRVSYQWQIVDASGNRYNWSDFEGNGTVTGSDTKKLSISGIGMKYNGYYVRCVASNPEGKVISEPAKIRVVLATADIRGVELNSDTTTKVESDCGIPLELEASEEGTGYEWQKQVSVSGKNQFFPISTLIANGLVSADIFQVYDTKILQINTNAAENIEISEGTYRCVITNGDSSSAQYANIKLTHQFDTCLNTESSTTHACTCSRCGIAKTENHVKKWVTLQEPTVDSKGKRRFICTKCSYTSAIEWYEIEADGTIPLTFHYNGGTLNGYLEKTITLKPGQLILPEDVIYGLPTKEGYTFLGWSKDSSAVSPDYSSSEKVTIVDEGFISLYAVWKANIEDTSHLIYSLNVDVTEPIGGETWEEVTCTTKNTLKSPFTGWYPMVNGEKQDSLEEGALFESGKKYRLETMIWPAAGYEFADEIAVTVNGKAATLMVADRTAVGFSFDFTAIEPHIHNYNQKKAVSKYLKKEATCTKAAVYYRSCGCGEMSDGTFSYGEPLGHDYSKKIQDEEHLKEKGTNCREYNIYWYDCSRCDACAKDDLYSYDAFDKYYVGTETGSHNYGSDNICDICGYDKGGTSTEAPAPSTPSPTEPTAPSAPSPTEPVLTKGEQATAKKLGLTAKGTKKILAYAKKNKISTGTLYVTEKTITSQKSEDVKAANYRILCARASKTTNTGITLTWTKVKGADGYLIFGNKCGTKNKYKRITTVSKKKNTYTQTKRKKGTYYKYLVIAYKLVDKKKVTIAVSKTVHAVTTGGKYGNAKSVKVNLSKVTVKKNKSVTLKASEVKKDKKISRHRSVAFESGNPAIATVSSKGKVTGKKKGTCYIYVYAQNGIYKRIKVTVK